MSFDLFINAGVQVGLDTGGPVEGPLAVHERLPGYAPTPLVDATALAASLGVSRLWVKDECSRLGLPAFKMLGASWAVYRVLVDRLGAEPSWRTIDELRDAVAPMRPFTLAAATDGNHGRAVARMARLLGFDGRIFVPAGTVAARIEGIESEGATVEVVDGTYDEAVVRSAAEAGERCAVISDTSWPGYEDVPRWVVEGYSTIFHEIDGQLEGGEPDVVFVQMGVGAFAAAVIRHYRRPGLRIVGVEPTRAACVLASLRAGELTEVPGPHDSIMAGLNCGLPSMIAWPSLRAGLDAVVAVGDGAARQAMRDLAVAGVVSGESGAAGLAGLAALVAEGRTAEVGIGSSSRVLVFSTEGATDPDAYRSVVGA